MVKKQDPDERLAFADRLNKALDHQGVASGWGRQTAAGKLFGMTPRGAGKLLKGEMMPATKRIPDLARQLGVRAEWLLTGKGEMLAGNAPSQMRVPIVGTLENGITNPVGSGFLDIPSADPDAFALRATTDALSPRIRAGEAVLVEPRHATQSGDEVFLETTAGVRVGEFVVTRGDDVIINTLDTPSRRDVIPRGNIKLMHVITGVFRASVVSPG